MTTFFMFGNYTGEATKDISASRTNKAKAVIKRNGGKTKSIYALLGENDLVIIAELRDVEAAMKTSLELNTATGIAFHSMPAVEVKAFDKLARR